MYSHVDRGEEFAALNNGAIYLTDITGGTVYELVPPL